MSLKKYAPHIKEFLEMMKKAEIDYSCWFTDDKDVLGSRSMNAEHWLRFMIRDLKEWCKKLDNPRLFMKTLLDAINTDIFEKTLNESMEAVTDEYAVMELEGLLENQGYEIKRFYCLHKKGVENDDLSVDTYRTAKEVIEFSDKLMTKH